MRGTTKQTLKIYWKHTANYPVAGVVSFLSVIMASVAAAIIPLYFKDFFNTLAGHGPIDLLAHSLILTLGSIAILEAIQWVGWRVSGVCAVYVQTQVMADLSNMCFKYLHKHSFSYFNNSFVGGLVKRVKWFSNAYENIYDQFEYNLLPLVVNLVVILVVLTRLNPWLGLSMATWIAIFMTINGFFTRYKMKYDLERNAAETASTGLLADTITNNANVKFFNGYDREVAAYAGSIDHLRKLRKFSWDLSTIFDAVQALLSVVLEIGIFYIAIRLWQRGILTIGDFVLIQAYILNIIMRVWDFGRMIRRIYENLSDAAEMTQILELPHEINDTPTATALRVEKGAIEFKNVVFNYHETRTVLNHLNLEINPGERIALIGPSGAGKTTIIKLLLRMHDLTAGHIFIDGQDILHVTQDSLWQNISLVPQDPILFHRTLRENIRYGKPDATDEEVIEASKLAHCHEFITESEHGYYTYVGERGIKLSGGERQRVAIARAILRNAPILILDEATSSLDSESEGLIQQALETLMKGKTVIVIAHRLSTIRQADRIIVINHGAIAEEGTHDELIAHDKGIYQKFWQLQAGGFIA